MSNNNDESKGIRLVIAGGGIVGLTLALCLHKQCGMEGDGDDSKIEIVIYEQSTNFASDVGAGMGLHPNGLRVLRDVGLLKDLVQAGQAMTHCRWTWHNGNVIAVAEENAIQVKEFERLSNKEDDGDDNSKNYACSNRNELNNNHTADHLGEDGITSDNAPLMSIGIRRWRLQKILFDAVKEKKGISMHFGKRVIQVSQEFGRTQDFGSDRKDSPTPDNREDKKRPLKLRMTDGTFAYGDVLFASDGNRSAIREQMLKQLHEKSIRKKLNLAFSSTSSGPGNKATQSRATATAKIQSLVESEFTGDSCMSRSIPDIVYSGMSCIMGIAEHSGKDTSVSYPTSDTSDSHAVIFPTGHKEQCFQYFFPVPKERAHPGDWSPLMGRSVKTELSEFAMKLRTEGWHEDYINPLENAKLAVRFGVCLLAPNTLNQFSFNVDKRIVLVGDAAHPSIPYLGQGAQIGLEDAGTIALLLRHYCLDTELNKFTLDNFGHAMRIYDKIRIPRTSYMQDQGLRFGNMQALNRSVDEDKQQELTSSVDKISNLTMTKEVHTRVAAFKSSPGIVLGSDYDYKVAVSDALLEEMQFS